MNAKTTKLKKVIYAKHTSYKNKKSSKAKLTKEVAPYLFYIPKHTLPIREHISHMIQKNVLNRSSLTDSVPFLDELGKEIEEQKQSIQFTPNEKNPIHRWTPYIQGFSASFVQRQFAQYQNEYDLQSGKHWVLDPFAGSGTVLVQSKFNGIPSLGTELNPLLQFIANSKGNSWNLSGIKLLEISNAMIKNRFEKAPEFLKSADHFKPKVLRELERIRGGIKQLEDVSNILIDNQAVNYVDLLRLALSSILVDCSNLKRTPCLGYDSKKKVTDDMPQKNLNAKVGQIAHDLDIIHLHNSKLIDVPYEVHLANAMEFNHTKKYAMAITSPPYMNGLDYVMNYKIEMAWLDFVNSHVEAKAIKDEMVVCDNVSKGLTKQFAKETDKYNDPWLNLIVNQIQDNINSRGKYRRMDMPNIVHKYFDDMYKVFKKVIPSIESNGRFVLVVGDSLIADVYLPTDLMLAKMGAQLGMEIEKIELARHRRSGQVRTYQLRETIITLKKK